MLSSIFEFIIIIHIKVFCLILFIQIENARVLFRKPYATSSMANFKAIRNYFSIGSFTERIRRLKIQRPTNFWRGGGGLKAKLHFGR